MKKIFSLLAASVLVASVCTAQAGWRMQPVQIQTRWAKDVSPTNVLPEYPRPMMVRPQWQNLNGLWEYAIAAKDAPMPARFDGNILVPYAIESALSGVKKPLLPNQTLWYKRSLAKPAVKAGERVLLHFGAVDWQTTVSINGQEVGQHSGGYQAFSFDVTDALTKSDNELVVKVYDPTDAGPNPHGKQVLNPQNIYYTPTSGIWQTVWLETVPATYITKIRSTPDIDKKVLNVTVSTSAPATGAKVQLTARAKGKVVASVTGAPGAALKLAIPTPHLWSPDDPFLYDLSVTLVKGATKLDQVDSYFGMRKIAIQKDKEGRDRIFLNNKFTYNLGTLDQGFWPDGLYTAPTDAALAFDIKASKAMGFNTIRKHIKVEPARWYYHADKLGMLVWQDMVNPQFGLPPGAKEAFEKESAEILEQLHNYPSITTWVLFNERWGAYDQKRLTEWIKATDPSRLVNGHSGELLYVDNKVREPSDSPWPSSDILDVHSYPSPMPVPMRAGAASVVGEFGGIGVPIEGHLWNDLEAGWGYGGTVGPVVMRQQFTRMIDSLKTLETQGLSGSIYTQPFDVESEQNGLITYDREIIKLPVSEFRSIHAHLWPATANVAAVTQDFAATVADTTPPDYPGDLALFKQGKKDPKFLRTLLLRARAQNDLAAMGPITAAYVAQMQNPWTEENLKFLSNFTGSTRDTGFVLFLQNKTKVDSVLGKDASDALTTRLIERDYILAKLPRDNSAPNWTDIEKDVVARYGALGQEIFYQTRALYYAQRGDWTTFATVAKPWFEPYGSKRTWISPNLINQCAWAIFQTSADTSALRMGLTMIQHALTVTEAPELLDTQANLLYKLGEKDKALAIQAKAVAAQPGNEGIKATYEKMQRGEPTWQVAPR